MQLLKDAFSSKKFVVMIAAIVMVIGDKVGLDLDPDMVNKILAIVGAYIVGQGIADHGKEAAKVAASSAVPVTTTTVEKDHSGAEKTTTTTIEPKV